MQSSLYQIDEILNSKIKKKEKKSHLDAGLAHDPAELRVRRLGRLERCGRARLRPRRGRVPRQPPARVRLGVRVGLEHAGQQLHQLPLVFHGHQGAHGVLEVRHEPAGFHRVGLQHRLQRSQVDTVARVGGHLNRAQLALDLQAWCKRAEASGIAALQEFSMQMRAARV